MMMVMRIVMMMMILLVISDNTEIGWQVFTLPIPLGYGSDFDDGGDQYDDYDGDGGVYDNVMSFISVLLLFIDII